MVTERIIKHYDKQGNIRDMARILEDGATKYESRSTQLDGVFDKVCYNHLGVEVPQVQ